MSSTFKPLHPPQPQTRSLQQILRLRKTKPDHFIVPAIGVKRRNRDRGHPMLDGQALAKGKVGLVADARIVVQLKIGTAARQGFETRFGHGRCKKVAFLLVKSRQSQVFPRIGHKIGKSGLHRMVGAEDIELMHFAKLGA